MQRFIAAATPRGISVCKQRRAMGRDGLASLSEPAVAGCGENRKLTSIANAVVRK